MGKDWDAKEASERTGDRIRDLGEENARMKRALGDIILECNKVTAPIEKYANKTHIIKFIANNGLGKKDEPIL